MDVVTYALAQKYVKNAIGSLDTVTDVTVDGNSVVNEDGVAEIVTPQILGEVADVKVNGQSVVDSEGVANITMHDTTLAKNFADEYDASTSYEVGDLCIKDLVLYRCTTATTGTWDDTKWEEVTVDGVLDEAGKVDDVQTYGGNTLVTNKIADLSALTIKKSIPSTPTDIANFTDGAEMVMPSLKVAIEPQQDLSHGDPSPTNICPISGWDEAVVTRCGKNFVDDATAGNYINTDGTLVVSSGYKCTDYIDIEGITSIKTSITTEYTNFWLWRIATYDSDKNFISLILNRTITNGVFTETVNIPNNAKYIRACAVVQSTNWTLRDVDKINTYTIDLDGTRYGGTLDVVSGVLTVDRAEVDMGDLTWTYSNGFFRTLDLNATIKRPLNNYAKGNILSSEYVIETWNAIQSTDNGKMAISSGINDPLIVCNTDYTDATAFKTAMNGVQLVYELATPLTIQLTPTAIKSLEGENNLFADSGEILDGEYLADASTVIASLDARITALENV